MLVASADNPQKPVVSLGSTVWSFIPAAPGQPATVAVKADADIPDLKMHATMTLRKNTDPTLQATHTIDLKFSFADGAPITGFKDVGLPQMRKEDSTAAEALTSVKVKISDIYFLIALAKGEADTARNLDLMQTRAWFDFPLLLNDDRIAKVVFQKSAEGRRCWRRRSTRGSEPALSAQVEHPRRDEIAVLDHAEGDRRPEAVGVGRPLRRGGSAQKQLLAAPQGRRAVAVDGQERQFRQTRLHRQKRAGHQARVVGQAIERNRRVGGKRADAGPAQFDHMAVAAERAAEIAGDRAHVGALAALGLEHAPSGSAEIRLSR